MSQNYTRDQLKISVGKILQTLGWNSINSTPLEILTDILGNYISQITKATNSYSNEFGCTQPNIDHLGLAFRDMAISVPELEEYVRYVNFGPPATPLPKYPIPKEDHLNFLKPGSKEVITRPVHIHEHLPPMNPLLEGSETDQDGSICKIEEINDESNSEIFKKPSDVLTPEFKRPNFRREEEGSRPTREISSVMMTTSGFLSPAREGKLPESRTPISSIEPICPPISTNDSIDSYKKTTRPFKKIEKKKRVAPSSNPQPSVEEKKRKLANVKNSQKAKQPRTQKTPSFLNGFQPSSDAKPAANKNNNQKEKINRVMAEIQLGKFNTTITPITVNKSNDSDNVDKLFTEPDKKKMNIFKKISNVKNEKIDLKMNKREEMKQESRETSPVLIIDEPDEMATKLSHLSSDVTIEPINPTRSASPDKIDAPYFDDDSPHGTPATPKTPEMISHSPPTVKEKRNKRKDGKKMKKVQKHQIASPHRLESDVLDLDMERPKTPEAQVLPARMEIPIPPVGGPLPFPFLNNFGGPGLIPPPLSTNPLFPNFHPMNIPTFGQKPLLTPISQNLNIGGSAKPEDYQKNEKNSETDGSSPKSEKKSKEHKKDKRDKIKKRNKKDKIKNKAEKRKLKEEKKDKIKKEKKEKRKDKEVKDESPFNMKITLKIKSPSPRPETPETKKLNIKPIVKKEEEAMVVEECKRETSPGLAKISALVCGPPKPKVIPPLPLPVQPPEETIPEALATPLPRTGPGPGRPRIHPIKAKPAKAKKRRTPIKKDAEGNEVWICPACGRQDDGSPMIGCDGCDAWYHWVCVGIQVPPDDNEDWYCRLCLSKKNEDLLQSDKKKKRKKREKKEH